MRSALMQWEEERTSRAKRLVRDGWTALRAPTLGVLLALAGFLMGVRAAPVPESGVADPELRDRLEQLEVALKARQGELELVRLEVSRLTTLMDYSRRYRIPADLAAAIHDIALAEGIDPALAYRLVRVESGFVQRAVSPVGAVGLAQLMPRTAFELDPTLGYSDLFDRDTNLRLGFQYLRQMIERYNGDLRLALLAYNRGPGTVDNIRREGGDPANGYARAVLGQ